MRKVTLNPLLVVYQVTVKINTVPTANLPPNISPTDEANAPVTYAGISAKCSDDGQ